MDAHKRLQVPYGSGIVFCRGAAALRGDGIGSLSGSWIACCLFGPIAITGGWGIATALRRLSASTGDAPLLRYAWEPGPKGSRAE